MSVAVVFEVQTTEDEPLHELLTEIDALPHWERQIMIGRVMTFRGQQMIEEAVGVLAIEQHYTRKKERAAATRERRKGSEVEETR